MMDRAALEELREQYRKALLDDVVAFWERHSVDREFGGFVTHLDRDGEWYGDQKAVWLQGRESWLFLTLYQELDAQALGASTPEASDERRRQWLALGRDGCRFLSDYCIDEQGKMYFEVTRDGEPLRMRRHFYSEVFGVLAFGALARIGGYGGARALGRARELFDSFVGYLRGTKRHPAIVPKSFEQPPTKALSPLMCLLNMCDTMVEVDPERRATYESLIDSCIAEIESDFVRHDLRCVLESVPVERLNDDKKQFAQPQNRVMNPGHAIECAWFMLQVVYRRRRQQQQQGSAEHEGFEPERLEHIVQQALLIIDYCFERGWDDEASKYGGGFLYFVDILGRPPIQLEWDQKLWWPHNEALIALALAYHMTHDAKYAQLFRRVHRYTWSHFPDPEHGEWFGYLHRDGSVLTPLKGGTWKGAFHVPRCLLKCYQIFSAELQHHQQQQE